jgi:uroporphyrin-III C-methyltransferase
MTDGTVHIVGAGPGDPELMTVKARRLTESADVVLYDSLVGDGIVDSLSEEASAVNVGKTPGGERTPQCEINRRMVAEARAGNDVVRLKCGDPNVFGRGGEEAEHLASKGVDFEVVPGVTSAIAAPTVEGIPATHRDHSSSLTVVTGHEDPTKDESALDWSALAANLRAGGTLVILMGVSRLPDNVSALRRNGVSDELPVAMVERATLDGSRTLVSNVGGIVSEARAAGIEPPATTVVGDVVGVRDEVEDHLAGSAPGSPVSEETNRLIEAVRGD